MRGVRRRLKRAAPFAATGLSSASNFLAGLLAVLSGSTAQFGAFSFAMALILLVVMLNRSAIVEPVLSSGIKSGALVPIAGVIGLIAGVLVAVSGAVIGGGMGSALLIVGVALPFLLMQDTGRAVLIHADRSVRALSIEVVWLVTGTIFVLVGWAVSDLSPLIVLAAWSLSGVVASVVLLVNRSWLPGGSVSEVIQFVRERLFDVVATAVLLRGSAQVATLLSGVVLGLVAFGALRTSVLLLTPLNPIIQAVRVLALRSSGEVAHRTRHARRIYEMLVLLIAAWLGAMILIASSFPEGDLFGKVDLVVLALVGCAWILQAIGTYLETTYRLADRYRELSRRYMMSSPLTFTVVVSSAALGLRPAAAGILLAAAIRCAILSWHRYSELSQAGPAFAAPTGQLAALATPTMRPAAVRASVSPTAASVVRPSTRAQTVMADGRRRALERSELLLTVLVLASFRPFRAGALGQLALMAQYGAAAFAVWDIATRPGALRRWCSHVYIWVPLAVAAGSLLWSVAPRSTIGGLVDLVAVGAFSVMIMARLPPTRRLVPIFRAALIVGLVNLAVVLSGSGAGPRGSFIGLFEQKNGLGRAAFLIVICGLVLAVLGEIRTRDFVASLAVALTLAVFARSGTATLLIVAALLLSPLLFQRLREVESYRFNALLLYAFAGGLTAWAAAGAFDPIRAALQLLGRNLDQNTAEVRRSLWRLVVEDIAQRPWFGHGYSTFELGDIVIWTGTRQTTWSVQQAHNGFIDLGYQLGLLGLVMVIGLQFSLLIRVARAARRHPQLRPWLVALIGYTVLIAGMNWTYSTLFGRLGIFWLLQSVLAVAAADRIGEVERLAADDDSDHGHSASNVDSETVALVEWSDIRRAEPVDDDRS